MIQKARSASDADSLTWKSVLLCKLCIVERALLADDELFVTVVDVVCVIAVAFVGEDTEEIYVLCVF